MEMEVMMPSPARDFNFDSASTTPFISAPSSPQRFGSFFYSAPTSPSRISANIPFHWEERPGTPKTATSSNYGDAADQDLDDADFAFDFSGHLERHSLPADELFHGGQIKPLKPPPPFHYDPHRPPKSPRKAFSPRHRVRDVDPFAAAIEQTTKKNTTADRRGRERKQQPPPSSRERNKGSSRSLSPFRVSDLLFDPAENDTVNEEDNPKTNNNNSIFSSSFWYKKWKIKDLLLFRSASESRAKDKQYSQLKKTPRADDVRNSSFRSTDSAGSVSSRRPPISAHELHYTVNRAFSEEMRRRTLLPYKQGLLGCLGFNPAAPDMSKGISPATSLPRV
ncbi:uncharacterized protein LOC131004725 [Salvia miltiorrhiza]|uniref:uncharacterized protein LOC131004725 n=1 Tax=Salvia miltiorrhiza TaxID=226208 RepID=UPI0025AC285E|nr:uncharacterized protein LOC131004725 [Salvia miltiorrhiza]